MSDGIGQALTEALTSIVSAIAGIIKGVADAISQHAGTLGQILVIGGIVGFALYTLFRGLPFARGILGRILP